MKKKRVARTLARPAPLGTAASPVKARYPKFPIPVFVATAAYAIEADERKTPYAKIKLDRRTASVVEFPKSPIMVDETKPLLRSSTMTLTLKGLSKNGRAAFYAGAAQGIRISLGAFPNKTAPQTIDVPEGVFAGGREPKVKMTAEERKAARAGQPKPTLAERIAKREAQLEKDKARLAKESTQPTM